MAQPVTSVPPPSSDHINEGLVAGTMNAMRHRLASVQLSAAHGSLARAGATRVDAARADAHAHADATRELETLQARLAGSPAPALWAASRLAWTAGVKPLRRPVAASHTYA